MYNDIEWDKYKAGLEATPCTNQILNQNMTRQDSGLKGVYDFSTTSTDEELKKIFSM